MTEAPIRHIFARKVWAYLSEVVLSFFLLWHVQRWIAYESVKTVVIDNVASWITLCAIMFAARVALWVLFNNMAMKPFGVWLEKQRLLDTIQHALAWPLFVFPATIITCIVARSYANKYIIYFTVLMLIYSFVNLFTMISNTRQLVRLSIRFDMESKQ